MPELMTLNTLGTFFGAAFAVTIITQFIKSPLDKLVRTPTRLTALAVAWLVLLGRRYAIEGTLHADGVYLDLLNGFMVAMSAMGAHSLARDNLQWK